MFFIAHGDLDEFSSLHVRWLSPNVPEVERIIDLDNGSRMRPGRPVAGESRKRFILLNG